METLLVRILIGNRPDSIRQAPFRDHRRGNTCDLFNVRAGPRGHFIIAKVDFFGSAAPHRHRHAGNHLLARLTNLVTLWHILYHAEGASARDNRRFMDRQAALHVQTDNGVARFMISCHFFFFIRHGQRAALCAHHDFVTRIFKFAHGDFQLITARR